MQNTKFRNSAATLVLTLILGAFVGLVLWLFLQVMHLGTTLIWEIIPGKTGFMWLLILLCAAGGCLSGLLRKKYGDYPEELPVIMGKIKKEKHRLLFSFVCLVMPGVRYLGVSPGIYS